LPSSSWRTTIVSRILATATMGLFLPAGTHSRADSWSWSSSTLANDSSNGNILPLRQRSIPSFANNNNNLRRNDGAYDRDTALSNGTVYGTCPDLSYITGPMHTADEDKNGFLNQEEYVSFTDAISGGYLSRKGWAGDFVGMPLSLQQTYLVLSCLCELYEDQAWGGPGCCAMNHLLPNNTIGIRTDGAGPGEDPDEIQLNYLTYVCGTMSESLEGVGAVIVAPPTTSPKPTSRPTLRPTRKPTAKPTQQPTTATPTTSEPTKRPTPLPSKKPTLSPSPSPTVLPPNTPFPTIEPPPNTPFPTQVEPTARPVTKPPTPQPTVVDGGGLPAGAPTKRPTPAPTEDPKVAPTKRPTPEPIEDGTPTKKPTPEPVEPGIPTKSPTARPIGGPTQSPTVSSAPSYQPTGAPSVQPSKSSVPTASAVPSASPSASFPPTLSAAPSLLLFTGEVPASVIFVASLNGKVTAAEIMAGETNQVKIMLEEQLLVLSDIVIREEFYNITVIDDGTNDAKYTIPSAKEAVSLGGRRMSSAGFAPSSIRGDGRKSRIRRTRDRILAVEKATLVTLDSVQDVECPSAPSNQAQDGAPLHTECLHFYNTVLLSMVNEVDVEGNVEIFEAAMQAKIAEGWLAENFDPNEALKPDEITDPTQPENKTLEPQKLSAGAIVGIVVAVLCVLFLTLMFGGRYRRERDKEDGEYDLERQQEIKDSTAVQDDITNVPQDGLDPSPQREADDASSMSASTATGDQSFSSQDPLLPAFQRSSTADMTPTLGSVLEDLKIEEDSSEVEDSIYSIGDVSVEGYDDLGSSTLAAMAGASTLVASSTSTPPPSQEMESYSPVDFSDRSEITSDFPAEDLSAVGSSISHSSAASPLSAGWPEEERRRGSGAADGSAVGGDGGGGESFGFGSDSTSNTEFAGPNVAIEEGGLSAGAAAAIGTAGAGVLAAGAYAVTRNRSTTPERGSEEDSSRDDSRESNREAESRNTLSSRDASTPSTVPNAMDDLDNAIESGNWGQVGALAAVLASQTQGSSTPPQSRKGLSRSGGSIPGGISGSASYESSAGASGSRSSGHGSNLDQVRANEIDRLVESGDWQGVVLAAARFEADSTFDGESFSASASQSSRWTGSATSATTPRSMATTDQSASNVSSQRGQEEIRAEVEALVRRVVPEEADNIEEMMMQFKGREEELVETLRRMQERAIASRARLAVQKSAKLEARAKASPKNSSVAAGGASTSSVASTGSANSTKSELEEAIEAGNWQAVGLAAQKMSDASVGDLSDDDKARLHDAISKSPAFSRVASGGGTSDPGGSRGSMPSEDYDLDNLIERGDWPGVIAAAKAASEGPDISISMEEQDALAQANMWQEIADQSKQDARQGPAGAGDAAAWAISRSLNAMNTSGDSSSAAVRTIADIADEQDSDASQYESSSYGDSAGRSLEEYTKRGI